MDFASIMPSHSAVLAATLNTLRCLLIASTKFSFLGGLGINFSYWHEPEGDFILIKRISINNCRAFNLAVWALLANIAKFNTRN